MSTNICRVSRAYLAKNSSVMISAFMRAVSKNLVGFSTSLICRVDDYRVKLSRVRSVPFEKMIKRFRDDGYVMEEPAQADYLLVSLQLPLSQLKTVIDARDLHTINSNPEFWEEDEAVAVEDFKALSDQSVSGYQLNVWVRAVLESKEILSSSSYSGKELGKRGAVLRVLIRRKYDRLNACRALEEAGFSFDVYRSKKQHILGSSFYFSDKSPDIKKLSEVLPNWKTMKRVRNHFRRYAYGFNSGGRRSSPHSAN